MIKTKTLAAIVAASMLPALPTLAAPADEGIRRELQDIGTRVTDAEAEEGIRRELQDIGTRTAAPTVEGIRRELQDIGK